MSERKRISPAVATVIGLPTLALAGLLWFSCRPAPTVAPGTKPTVINSPEPQIQAEQLAAWHRSGHQRLTGALNTIREAYRALDEAALRANGDTRGALEEARDLLDTAGADLAEHLNPPPTPAQTAGAFGPWDERRLNTIAACETTLATLAQARGTVRSLLPNDRLLPLVKLIELASQDVRLTIQAYGGQSPVNAEDEFLP